MRRLSAIEQGSPGDLDGPVVSRHEPSSSNRRRIKIDSAEKELDLLSYTFTSVRVVEALVRGRHRG